MPIVEASATGNTPTSTSDAGDGSNGNDGENTETAAEILQSTLTKVFDSMYASLHQIIRQNVRKLPFLDNDADTSISATGGNRVTCSNETDNENNNSRNNIDAQKLSGEQKLLNLISNVYEKHVDTAHVYAENELFTIDERQFSKKKRERMFEDYRRRYLEQGENHQTEQNEKQKRHADTNNINCTDDHTHKEKNPSNRESETKMKTKTTAALSGSSGRTGKDSASYSMPASEADIPSPEQIRTLDEELTSLQRRINQMKRQNQNLQSQLQSIHKTKSVSQEIKQITTSSLGSYSNQQGSGGGKNSRNKLQDSINAAMIGKDGLEELCKDGENIITKLDEIKNARGDDNNDGVKEWSEEIERQAKEARDRADAANNRPPKKMTLEEDYKERMGNGNNRVGSICVSSNFLRK